MASVRMADDRELLTAWANGDAKAGATLLERHFDRLRRFFDATAPTHAEDLVQNTLLACVQARDRFRGDSSFVTFLLGIARNQVLMWWRTRARRGPTEAFDELSLEALGASPSTMVAQRREQQLLLAALRRIPLGSQILLQLHYWDGLGGAELATVLGIPEGTVRSRLRRAKELARQEIETLAADAAELASMRDGFDGWIASLRKHS